MQSRKPYISRFSQRFKDANAQTPQKKQAKVPDAFFPSFEIVDSKKPVASVASKFGFQAPSVQSSPVKQTIGNVKSRLTAPTFASTQRKNLKANVCMSPRMNTSMNNSRDFIEPTSFMPQKKPSPKRTAKQVTNENSLNQKGIERFKNANFSLIELMRQRKADASQMSQSSRAHSGISTPRLTPLRLIERNRSTDKNDIFRLEDKIKQLETQINHAKTNQRERNFSPAKLSPSPNLDDSVLREDELALLEDFGAASQFELIGLDDDEEKLRMEICGLQDNILGGTPEKQLASELGSKRRQNWMDHEEILSSNNFSEAEQTLPEAVESLLNYLDSDIMSKIGQQQGSDLQALMNKVKTSLSAKDSSLKRTESQSCSSISIYNESVQSQTKNKSKPNERIITRSQRTTRGGIKRSHGQAFGDKYATLGQKGKRVCRK